ncbi:MULTISPECIES: DUF3558 domain-containing protein [Actinopolyspora]|uniref:DUF3558 domain-containing protein n=1 Tax=Actinopolyspora saharensis TaxID=995062 RepID=A0A1H0ZVC3_9ACTN|nr:MULTISPECIES: DUF3558 domain-containing protein [Actinopolyspora]NHD15560.1 DUF3558 domain-containing protein [Actinopolyspora sp. BKK2]NHE75226.1 DUF3558 domain-containing protein [Actinopolyspora sp. BKK1]SDQ31368.1 Protein of unknown function [Actinopolyspora saharensis]
MRNTITTSISLLAGILLLAGCGGQTDQTAQNTTTGANTPTSTSNAAGVNLPERTAPAKSLKLDNPCSIITQQQQNEFGVNRTPQEETSNGKRGCKYERGDAGSNGGWYAFVAADPNRTAQEFGASNTNVDVVDIGEYSAYQSDDGSACMIAVDVAESGSVFVNGITRLQENRPDACPLFTKFAEAAVQNLENT